MPQVDAAGLQLPLLAKSLLADGSSDSHKVAIIHDLEGLACVVRGDVPVGRMPRSGARCVRVEGLEMRAKW